MKLFFDHLSNMKDYTGPEENIKGGGRYVDEKGYGHELFNFLKDNGRCYGYTTPWGKVNLESISKTDIKEDKNGRYLDGVLVVFTCSNYSGKRVIAGFYQNARVYAEAVSSRLYKDESINYNLICRAEDAILIPRENRIMEIPYSKSSDVKGGHGQSNLWYAQNIDDSIVNELLQYIENVRANKTIYVSDEHKYDETKTYTTSLQQSARSREARNKCIELKGCHCNICGFDFEKTYGELGKDYIEVHHIMPIGQLIASIGYEGTDPKKDLIPLCSNCHAMIHRRKNPPYSTKEIEDILKR